MLNLVGEKFNNLKVVSFSHTNKYAYWNCVCDCGEKHVMCGSEMKRSRHKLHRCKCNYHGESSTRLYQIWKTMIQRCNPHTKNKQNRKNYVNRGIKVCKSWDRFIDFKRDMSESYLKHCQYSGEKQTTLDRRDNNKGYSKNNCRWATYRVQGSNKRNNRLITHNDKTKTITEWSKILGIPIHTLKYRIKLGWSIEKALTTKVRGR